MTISNFTAGDLCPEHCGSKLYRYDPGILVRIKGQNLASVHKYWVEKLRCASCSCLVSTDIPRHVGTEKYDAAFKAILSLQKYYVAIGVAEWDCFERNSLSDGFMQYFVFIMVLYLVR